MTPFLQKFTFTGFNDKAAMSKIKNTGKTVKVEFIAGTLKLHIVNAKSIYNGKMAKILQESEGLAALGFFIEVESGTTDQPASWRNLTAHLSSITEKGQYADITGISMDYLISGGRPPATRLWYGPSSNIKVNKNLIDLFSTTVRVGNSSSPFMTNVYRSVQSLNGR
ncbi:hypothetical protein AALO_G00270290 [Alosa alosa]|uniref:Alpha-carbonic anhydrase domain-containing protein n=1 Tax=Alosa alosa TaxID=278164 RepID=A0AAV6FN83_9TELE|nr:hypothetical protein AALO_G00270290 [Alosa alosa]